MIVLRLGWRNLWRNSRRSLITVAGIAVAFAFLIGLVGFARGLVTQLLQNGTGLLVGHAQVHARSYLPDRDLHETVGGVRGCDWGRLLADLRRDVQVRGLAPRVYGFGLLSTGDHSCGAQVIGIEPQGEASVSRTIASEEFEKLREPYSLLVGELLAQELGAVEGAEVAVVAQAADGTLGNELFRVRGIVRTGLAYLDRSLAFARLQDVQSLLVLAPERIHEIAIRIDDPLAAPDVSRRLSRMPELPEEAAVRSWRELLPQLSEYADLAGGVNAFIIGLVVVFAAIGVLNTMMMATFERMREIGMLNALGMRPTLITASILAESLFLALLGVLAGFAGGSLLMHYLATEGLDLSPWMGEFSMVGTRLNPVVTAVWDWNAVVWTAVSLSVATVLAAYIPARKATLVDPVEALHAPVGA